MCFSMTSMTMVPNVPCGVESISDGAKKQPPVEVPNVPCGVESITSLHCSFPLPRVPNVPCGVERTESVCQKYCHALTFLMYRVELKVKEAFPQECPYTFVPNVPCGVESCL